MGGIVPQLLTAKVMHKRLFPKENGFHYGIYYYALPLSGLAELPVKVNKPAMVSFYERDHGYHDGSDLKLWARNILNDYNITKADGEIVLVTMPRILGYVFNPVSFWLCYDETHKLRAVISEVHNTFGEVHSYLCAHEDQRVIEREDVLTAQKLFHVSPFLEREGHYTFRFDVRPETFGVWIDFYDVEGRKKLVTSLLGKLQPLTPKAVRRAFWGHPLVTLKAIFLIHWQAVKLLAKGIKYIPKPLQKKEKVSASDNLTKN